MKGGIPLHFVRKVQKRVQKAQTELLSFCHVECPHRVCDGCPIDSALSQLHRLTEYRGSVYDEELTDEQEKDIKEVCRHFTLIKGSRLH